MSELLIKICGVRSPEIARVVAENGADLMGLIFAPARRQVTEEQAQRIVAGLDGSNDRPSAVLSRPSVIGTRPTVTLSHPSVILSRSEESPLGSPENDVGEPGRRSFAAAQNDGVETQDDRATAEVGGHRPRAVGVFVNESADEMNRLAESVGLDLFQLSGDEPVDMQSALNRPVIRALRLPVGITPAEAYEQAERYLDCPTPARALLLDTNVSGSYGGNGIPGDWNVARALAVRYPVILAGGLRPETVDDALGTVHPLGVDVSSGVETDGAKDPEKIRRFIAAARAASVPAGRSQQ